VGIAGGKGDETPKSKDFVVCPLGGKLGGDDAEDGGDRQGGKVKMKA